MDNENPQGDNQQNETPEEKANKVTKQYNNVLEIIVAVVGGKENLAPQKKIDGDVTATIVAELFGEEQAELIKKAKDGLRIVLKKHVELEADVAKKEKELNDLRTAKRKEFITAANDWLKTIEQGDLKKEGYAKALETAFKKEEEKQA